MNQAIQAVAQALKQHNRFVLTTHVNPDGDGLGSEVALAEWLADCGKQVTILNHSATPEVVNITEGKYSVNDLLVHNENDSTLAFILANMIHNPNLPRAMGVFLSQDRPSYEDQLEQQIAKMKAKKGEGDLQKLLDGDETWVIQ